MLALLVLAASHPAPLPDTALDGLPLLGDLPLRMENALWGEVPVERQLTTRKVTLADIHGPGVIVMLHFAMPESLKLDRSSVLRIWWDDEQHPSVEVPLVDFFCDPNGVMERVDTALVNKRRGWNAYFPMPFCRRARLELEHDGVGPAPCYFYCFWRPLRAWDDRLAYFHACWRQERLLLGRRDYLALNARGRGKFVGWNVTVRGLPPNDAGYPVDENAKFYVDGEREPSIELMGLEDAFGFSFGFPETTNFFPYTGWAPFYKGAFAYRFFVHDAVVFDKSLRVAIGFGKKEAPFFREIFSKPEFPLEFSSCCYWYQSEPHVPLPLVPRYRLRKPSPDADQLRAMEARSAPARQAGLALQCFLGHPDREDLWIADGYDCILEKGYRFYDTQNLWPNAPLKHCWASWEDLRINLITPRRVSGLLRLYILDGDNFCGGRRQHIFVGTHDLGVFADFVQGRWVELHLTPEDTASGEVPIRIVNAREGANVVASVLEFKPD